MVVPTWRYSSWCSKCKLEKHCNATFVSLKLSDQVRLIGSIRSSLLTCEITTSYKHPTSMIIVTTSQRYGVCNQPNSSYRREPTNYTTPRLLLACNYTTWVAPPSNDITSTVKSNSMWQVTAAEYDTPCVRLSWSYRVDFHVAPHVIPCDTLWYLAFRRSSQVVIRDTIVTEIHTEVTVLIQDSLVYVTLVIKEYNNVTFDGETVLMKQYMRLRGKFAWVAASYGSLDLHSKKCKQVLSTQKSQHHGVVPRLSVAIWLW